MALSSSLTTPKLGNTGVSSLIKSASTLENEVNTYNDTAQSIQFENNPSDSSLNSYLSYLDNRITSLQSTGSITDATKAMNLSQTMTSAVSKNTSFNIQNQTIQVLSGNASNTDKYNYIVSAYQRAAGIGDVTLSQSLESQAYSLSQTIQYDAQQSQAAAKTLADTNASGEQSVATSLTDSLKQLNNDVKNSGQRSMNSTLQAWVTANTGTLEKLGVKLPAGAQPNYFDLVNAVGGAIYNAHVLAYQAELPYNPSSAQTYMDQATALREGITTLPTLAGDLSAQQVQGAATNNAEYAYDQSSGKLIQTKQTGFNGYDANGQPVPTYSGDLKQTVFLTPQETTTMTKLGLSFTDNTSGKNAGTAGNGVEVQASKNSPAWLQQVLGPNGVSNIFTTDKGLVFEADGQEGGKAYYTLTTDSKGLVGLFQNDANGGVTALGGEYGFNTFEGASVFNVMNMAQATQNNIKLQSATNQAQLMASTPKPLPNISITPAATTSTQPTTIQAPQTTSVVQNANGNPQGNNNAGANINQSGGKGIPITGVTNGPVGIKL